jgi:hypothetical protein
MKAEIKNKMKNEMKNEDQYFCVDSFKPLFYILALNLAIMNRFHFLKRRCNAK